MSTNARAIVIVQARMGSKRLPGKVLRKIGGVPILEVLIRRLKKALRVEQIILATSIAAENDELEKFAHAIGIPIFRGDETDVLDRFYRAAEKFHANTIVRVTADCPLIDCNMLDQMIEAFAAQQVDYFSNTMPPSFPDGLDLEIFSFSALKHAHESASTAFEREHVTPFLRKNQTISRGNFESPEDYSDQRWTVDEAEDIVTLDNILKAFDGDIYFSWQEVINLAKTRPDLFVANQTIVRNEGAKMSTGQKLWRRAKTIIPGGNSLLSKRPEMFLPEKWPCYFSKAKGCRVWDLDDSSYLDLSIMGIGTNILGYGNSAVDDAVSNVISNGNMSSLNCPEEVYLSEALLELHPWADMVRLGRTGGETSAMAIRIARAASGRDKVAFCGYHGWHDWYLSANIASEKNLDSHLLAGLSPIGVPRDLSGSVLPFEYNKIDQLEALVKTHEIGVIMMEVSRNFEPNPGFLEQVRKISKENSIVLIFDECSSGFRETNGGLHLKYGVHPDMAWFGKALGNGYSITAILGTRETMEVAQDTFVSSTFLTERTGPVAALATLKEMKSNKSWEQITKTGSEIKKGWLKAANNHKLPITIGGLDALANFSFTTPDWLLIKTFICQEMLKRGYLASNSIYSCTAHTELIIEEYMENLDEVFGIVAKANRDGSPIEDLLEGPVCHDGFRRLN